MQAAIDRVLRTLSLRPFGETADPEVTRAEATAMANRLLDNYRRSLGACPAPTAH